MHTHRLSLFSKVMLFSAALLLIGSIFSPIWRIELDAPQYPEGLYLSISADGIGGNVEIINGLNHYIGMKTLHSEDFIEFTVLPYILAFFALAAVLTAVLSRKKILYGLLIVFVIFGTLSMLDFYKWNYDYGHDLDPTAAIKVPGMAYQPPLIGYKKLLNFGAYSIPDIGGWLLITSGLLILIAAGKEAGIVDKLKKKKTPALAFLLFGLLLSCDKPGPEAVKLNSDACEFCKMSISDKKFVAELITQKGRLYKFDDLICLLRHRQENSGTPAAGYFVTDYLNEDTFLAVENAFFVTGEKIKSPMGGKILAFSSEDSARSFAGRQAAALISWEEINPSEQ